MKAAIQVTYVVELDEEDVEDIQQGKMTLDDIDVGYYIEEFQERIVDNIYED